MSHGRVMLSRWYNLGQVLTYTTIPVVVSLATTVRGAETGQRYVPSARICARSRSIHSVFALDYTRNTVRNLPEQWYWSPALCCAGWRTPLWTRRTIDNVTRATGQLPAPTACLQTFLRSYELVLSPRCVERSTVIVQSASLDASNSDKSPKRTRLSYCVATMAGRRVLFEAY